MKLWLYKNKKDIKDLLLKSKGYFEILICKRYLCVKKNGTAVEKPFLSVFINPKS